MTLSFWFSHNLWHKLWYDSKWSGNSQFKNGFRRKFQNDCGILRSGLSFKVIKIKLHSLKSSNSFSGNNLCVLALRLISGWFLFSILVRILSFNSAFYDFLWFFVSRIFFSDSEYFRIFEFSCSVNCVVVRIATREGVVCLYTKIKLQNTEKLAPIQSKNDVTWLDPIKLIGWLTILVHFWLQKG